MTRQTARPLKLGLFLPIDELGRSDVPRWEEVKMMAQHAEAVGFDSIWLPDHLIYDFGAVAGMTDVPPSGVWECWSMLAALAASTTRIEVGTLVSCTGFRNPTLLAKMADTLEEISGGRLVLGLGAGYHETEFRAFGYQFDHLVGRFEEALQIIHTLLRTGEIDFRGQYYQAENCQLKPRGPRRQGPPILIAGTQPRMLRLAAQYADTWNGHGVSQTEALVAMRSSVDAACRKVGREPATLQRSHFLLVDLPGGYTGPLGNEFRGFRTNWASITLGAPDDFAELLREFARAGVDVVHIWPEPNTLAAIDALAPVLELLDRG